MAVDISGTRIKLQPLLRHLCLNRKQNTACKTSNTTQSCEIRTRSVHLLRTGMLRSLCRGGLVVSHCSAKQSSAPILHHDHAERVDDSLRKALFFFEWNHGVGWGQQPMSWVHEPTKERSKQRKGAMERGRGPWKPYSDYYSELLYQYKQQGIRDTSIALVQPKKKHELQVQLIVNHI